MAIIDFEKIVRVWGGKQVGFCLALRVYWWNGKKLWGVWVYTD